MNYKITTSFLTKASSFIAALPLAFTVACSGAPESIETNRSNLLTQQPGPQPTQSSTAWFALSLKQCMVPWGQAAANAQPTFPDDDVQKAVDYLGAQSVSFEKIGFLWSQGATCAACGCPSNEQLVVEAKIAEDSKLTALGFTLFAAGDALAYQPVQCGNPWDDGSRPESNFEEAFEVQAWTTKLGAPLASTGFVYTREPVATIAQCGAPDGGRSLVVVPECADAFSVLEANGFQSLSKPSVADPVGGGIVHCVAGKPVPQLVLMQVKPNQQARALDAYRNVGATRISSIDLGSSGSIDTIKTLPMWEESVLSKLQQNYRSVFTGGERDVTACPANL